MKTVKNNYHKKLIFPLLNLSIGANAIKTVSDSQAAEMTINKWIILHENVSVEKRKVISNDISNENKGRKQIINNKQ